MTLPDEAAALLAFWFEELAPAEWWRRSSDVDTRIAARFDALHARAVRCELASWRTSAAGRLAEVIVLDQFSRNLHRDDPRAFAADPLALALAQEAIARGDDQALPVERRAFLYLPFMHSESPVIHAQGAPLFEQPGLEANRSSAVRHREIIDRFGRFPHRNAVLGRDSTPEELAFLQTPGSSF